LATEKLARKPSSCVLFCELFCTLFGRGGGNGRGGGPAAQMGTTDNSVPPRNESNKERNNDDILSFFE